MLAVILVFLVWLLGVSAVIMCIKKSEGKLSCCFSYCLQDYHVTKLLIDSNVIGNNDTNNCCNDNATKNSNNRSDSDESDDDKMKKTKIDKSNDNDNNNVNSRK